MHIIAKGLKHISILLAEVKCPGILFTPGDSLQLCSRFVGLFNAFRNHRIIVKSILHIFFGVRAHYNAMQ